MMRKYLLSTGRSTDKIEDYIVDLFRLYLQIWPGDIPGMPSLGFDFIMTDVRKANLLSEVTSRVNSLLNKIKEKFGSSVSIVLDNVELLDESKVRVTFTVNDNTTEKIDIEI